MALTSKGHFKIDGNEYNAQSLKVNYSSLTSDDSGKTADGLTHLYYIFRKVRKVQITLPPCSAEDVAAVFDKVQGRIYELTYYDPLENAEKTIQCHTSSSTSNMYSGVVLGGIWQGVTFTAIEMAGEN